ncbi:HEPN domain-containing protein [Methylobacterium trifolii]
MPAEFDATGTYEDESVFVKALGFRVLAHAEFEEFLEERVTEIAKVAWASWKDKNHVSATAMCLIAFSGREMRPPPDTYSAPGENQRKAWPALIDVHEKLNDAVSQYIKQISVDNHGVREKNILSMLLPIGVDHKKIDGVFLTEIDDFGQQRGKAAHTSSAKFVQQEIDPKGEFDRVQKIINLLLPLDEELTAVLATCAAA